MNGLEILGKGKLSSESFPFPKSTRVESATPFPKFFVPIESQFTILSEAGCLWNTLFESGNTLPSHPSPPKTVKTPGKAGGLKRGDRSKRFLLFAYGELQQLKLLHLPVFFFLVPYVEPNFPFSYSYRAYKISSRPETRSCYFTNFFKMFRYLNSAFSF